MFAVFVAGAPPPFWILFFCDSRKSKMIPSASIGIVLLCVLVLLIRSAVRDEIARGLERDGGLKNEFPQARVDRRSDI